jgi:hypothetical protein
MYARMNTIFGREDMVDVGLSSVEGADRAAVEATGGNRGLTTLVDRAGGVIVAMSYWDEPGRSSREPLTRARDGAANAVEGDLVVETYEVASAERMSPAAPGATVRMVRVRIEPGRIADGLGFLREEVLARFRSDPEFCGAEILIDQRLSGGVLCTTWTGEAGATRADTLIDRLRAEAAGRGGVTFPRTETYALVQSSAQVG